MFTDKIVLRQESKHFLRSALYFTRSTLSQSPASGEEVFSFCVSLAEGRLIEEKSNVVFFFFPFLFNTFSLSIRTLIIQTGLHTGYLRIENIRLIITGLTQRDNHSGDLSYKKNDA